MKTCLLGDTFLGQNVNYNIQTDLYQKSRNNIIICDSAIVPNTWTPINPRKIYMQHNFVRLKNSIKLLDINFILNKSIEFKFYSWAHTHISHFINNSPNHLRRKIATLSPERFWIISLIFQWWLKRNEVLECLLSCQNYSLLQSW